MAKEKAMSAAEMRAVIKAMTQANDNMVKAGSKKATTKKSK